MKRIMYIERKAGGLVGEGRIGWVEFTQSKRSYRYAGRLLHRCAGYNKSLAGARFDPQLLSSGLRDRTPLAHAVFDKHNSDVVYCVFPPVRDPLTWRQRLPST